MKPFVIAALALGAATQAAAAQTAAPLSPAAVPGLARSSMPQYDIVTAKVVQGVKFANSAVANGPALLPGLPSQAVMQLLPSRSQ
jgi:hypothetical protein